MIEAVLEDILNSTITRMRSPVARLEERWRGVAELMQPLSGLQNDEHVARVATGTRSVATLADISNPLGCYGLEICAERVCSPVSGLI